MQPVCQLITIFYTSYHFPTYINQRKNTDSTEWSGVSKEKVRRSWLITKIKLSFFLNTKTDIKVGHVKTCMKPQHICKIIFILDFGIKLYR